MSNTSPDTTVAGADRNKFPLRTKKKAETRLKLVKAARDLFLSKGYEATTLEEVAEAAGLHVQTLYRHFATKQELANAGDKFWLSKFKDAITSPQREKDTFAFWRNWLTKSYDLMTEDGGVAYRQHIRMRHSTPEVLGAIWEIQAEYEDLLTQALSKDFNIAPDGPSIPRMAAGMLLTCNRYNLRSYQAMPNYDLQGETVRTVNMVKELFVQYLDRHSE